MKRTENSVQYSWFETRMVILFSQMYGAGASNESVEEQSYWPLIQELKALAIQEVLPDGLCPSCGAKVLGGEK